MKKKTILLLQWESIWCQIVQAKFGKNAFYNTQLIKNVYYLYHWLVLKCWKIMKDKSDTTNYYSHVIKPAYLKLNML